MPRIISFAWTTDAFLDGTKTVTRRDWNDVYAMSFHKDEILDAYNKSPRAGGCKIGVIRLTIDPYKQKLKFMPDSHFEREGGTRYWSDKAEFIVAMGGPEKALWVIEFVKIDVCDIIHQMELGLNCD